MAPEKLQSVKHILKELYEKDLLCLIAVDEAHCLSEWYV